MPVDNLGTFFPTPDVQFEAPAEKLEVTAEHGQQSTGFDERTPGDASETAGWHDQTPSRQFEQSGPQTVVVPGFERFTDAAQTKVVKAPTKRAGKGSAGAEGK